MIIIDIAPMYCVRTGQICQRWHPPVIAGKGWDRTVLDEQHPLRWYDTLLGVAVCPVCWHLIVG